MNKFQRRRVRCTDIEMGPLKPVIGKKVAHTRLPSVGFPELIPVLGSQPAGGVSHKPGCRLPLFSARLAVTPATLKRVATSFAAW